MAGCTIIPCSLVFATIDWKVLIVVIKGCWYPRGLIMTACTIIGKLQGGMRWCGGLVVIFLVAPCAGVWGIVKTVCMACCALIGDQCVCAGEYIDAAVIKYCRLPCALGMAGFTIR